MPKTEKNTKVVVWSGTIENCQICGGKLGSVMYDAKTRHGSWANMGHCCFRFHVHPMKVGQKYKRVGSQWHKVKNI